MTCGTALEDQSCQNCKFWMQMVESDPDDPRKPWAADDPLHLIGYCCKNPPTIRAGKDINGFAGMGTWPRTYAYEWCGAWELSPKETGQQE